VQHQRPLAPTLFITVEPWAKEIERYLKKKLTWPLRSAYYAHMDMRNMLLIKYMLDAHI